MNNLFPFLIVLLFLPFAVMGALLFFIAKALSVGYELALEWQQTWRLFK